MAKLKDILSPEELSRLQSLYDQKNIDDHWVQNIFLPRLNEDLRDISFWAEKYKTMDIDPKTREQFQKDLVERRKTLFERAMSQSTATKIAREGRAFHRGAYRIPESMKEYWEERGPVGVASDVGESILKSIPRGVVAAGQTITGGLGEKPIERIGEMAGIIPILGGGLGLAARIAGRSALKAAGRSALSGLGKEPTRQALRKVPGEAVKESLEAGVGSTRATLARQLSNVAEGTRIPGYIAEGADIVGAGEDAGAELLLEILGEGAMEAGRFGGRRAVKALSPNQQQEQEQEQETDPIVEKQKQRAAENDTATAETTRKVRGADSQAALDALAFQLVDLTEKIASGTENPTIDDLSQVTPEAFVNAFENEVYPQVADQIAALEAEGVVDAENVVRARILDLHNQIQGEIQQQLGQIEQAPKPEQEAAADLAGQPTETPIQAQKTPETPIETPQEPAPVVEPSEEVETTPEVESVEETTAETPPEPEQEVEPTPEQEPLPPTRVGTPDVAFSPDGQSTYQVQPVLRNLDELVGSHTIDGEKHPDYPEELQPRGETRGGQLSLQIARERAENPVHHWLLNFSNTLREGPPLTSKKYPRRSVSGSGRIQLLTHMRQQFPENWEAYQTALREHLETNSEKLNIDPAEVDAMIAAGQSPVLTYELTEDVDEAKVAREANEDVTLDNPAATQAELDTQYFDAELFALFQPTEESFAQSITAPENQAFREALFSRVPTNVMSGMMTEDNTGLSPDGIARIQNAMVKYVFGDEIGGQLAKLFIESGDDFNNTLGQLIRNTVAAFARAKANGHDIGQELGSALLRFLQMNKNAERKGGGTTKKERLYNEIELFFNSPQMIPVPLLEKQLLYLVYLQRNAPRRLTNDILSWLQTVQNAQEQESGGMLAGLVEEKSQQDIHEEVFAKTIRNAIIATAFRSKENDAGQVVLLGPKQMPFELVSVRQASDKLPTQEGQLAYVNEWIDGFLTLMNDGTPQTESGGGTPDATPEPEPTQEQEQIELGTADPDSEGDGGDATAPEGDGQGTPTEPTDRDITGTPVTPEDTGDVSPDERTADAVENEPPTDRDTSTVPDGDSGSTVEPERHPFIIDSDDLRQITSFYVHSAAVEKINSPEVKTVADLQAINTTVKITLSQARRIAWYLANQEILGKITAKLARERFSGQTELDMTTIESLMDDDGKIQAAANRIADYILEQMNQGVEANTALENARNSDVWFGEDIYNLETLRTRNKQWVDNQLHRIVHSEVHRLIRNANRIYDSSLDNPPDSPAAPWASPQETPEPETTPETAPQETEPEPTTPIDTNEVVTTVSRTSISTPVQRDLETIGVSVEEWERVKANDEVAAFINGLSQEQQESIEYGINLIADADVDTDAEIDVNIDDDFFGDIETGIRFDVSEQHRLDFDLIRRKMFLAKAIARLEAKGKSREAVESAQLLALKAPQRTTAQQNIYESMLKDFIDRQLKHLTAKQNLSAVEQRTLDALQAVEAEGLPHEASELSLYANLETPEQEHNRPLAETRTLAGVNTPDTSNTSLNLPESLTKDTTKLSKAQLTTVKAIVSALNRKIQETTDKVIQGGFLLGDKMGVGKTRQALATIIHFIREGSPKHLIIAPSPEILANYSEDYTALDGNATRDISMYNAANRKPSTAITTSSYASLITTPNLRNFQNGGRNAISDIIETLIGVPAKLSITNPQIYQDLRKQYVQILMDTTNETTETKIEFLINRAQKASQASETNPEYLEQFRQSVPPAIADLLLNKDQNQLQLFEMESLRNYIEALDRFRDAHLTAPIDAEQEAFQEAAEAFDGVIVIDEMHQAAGLDSQSHSALMTLQTLLPNARFLYMSATPFKDIENLAIADRLGLWGAGQPVSSFKVFLDTFKNTTRAIKEVIPLHLKQAGRFISRALSSRNTRYTPVNVPLTETQNQQYNKAAKHLGDFKRQYDSMINAALNTPWGLELGVEASRDFKNKYNRQFYNQAQKMMLAILDAMKAEGIQDQVGEQLKNGDKIIIQLENTWDKTNQRVQERIENELRPNTPAGPFDLLVDFMTNINMMPVVKHRVEQRGDRMAAVPIMGRDAEGKRVPLIDEWLMEKQQELLGNLTADLNNDPLTSLQFAADILHGAAQRAGYASGEISGRNYTHIGGKMIKMPQNSKARKARSEAFSNTMDLNMLVLGPAGLTGINLPITEVIKDDVNELYHYLLQSSWNVNTFEQGLGRGLRTNSAIDPHYIPIHQNLPGSERVLGAILAKFAEMGALAGQADNALMQNIDNVVDRDTLLDDDPEAVHEEDVDPTTFEDETSERAHIFGRHGQEALYSLWNNMGKTGDARLANILGLPAPEMTPAGTIDPKTVPKVQAFFGRLLLQPTERQPQLYAQFENYLKMILIQHKELGNLDIGASDLNSKDGYILDELLVHTDPDTQATTKVTKLGVKRKLPRRGWDFVEKVVHQVEGYEHHGGAHFDGYYADKDDKIWAFFRMRDDDGNIEFRRWGPRGTPLNENVRITERQKEFDFEAHTTDEAKKLWEAQDSTDAVYVDSELYLGTGMLLSKWLEMTPAKFPDAVMGVIPMQDGSKLHGRVIPPSAVKEVLENIGGVDPNHFDKTTEAEAAPALPDIQSLDIPSMVRKIIGAVTEPRIRARLEGITEHIHKKLPLTLKGHRIRSPQEAALLGQFIRDPQVEHLWVIYRREGRVAKIEPMSLNKWGQVALPYTSMIKNQLRKLHADDIILIHNHPSGIAEWSEADKETAIAWKKSFGTLIAEDIIVNSGTFAYLDYQNGEYIWKDNVPLNTDWDTSVPAEVDKHRFESRPGDPLHDNPLMRGAREAAAYGTHLKRSTDAVELIFVDKNTGQVVDTHTDTRLRNHDNPADYLNNLILQYPDRHVHVMMWGEDTSTAVAIQDAPRVDSVWLNSERWTGSQSVKGSPRQAQEARESKEITIGGKTHAFVQAPDNIKSDVNNPLANKSVIIAGVQHELTRDENREDLEGIYNRGQDAEHMVKPKSSIDRILQGTPEFMEFQRNYVKLASKLELDTPQIQRRLRILKNLYETDNYILHRILTHTNSLIAVNFSHNNATSAVAREMLRDIEKLLNYPEGKLLEWAKTLSINEKNGKQLDTGGLRELLQKPVTEADVYNLINEEGIIKATHRSGDPDINEGQLAYTSYGPYYRRGNHTYGYILDLQKILDNIPGVVGTIHTRKNWERRKDLTNKELRAAIKEQQGGDPDTVIEIRIPQDIDLNEYLLGVIEDEKVYVKSEEPNIKKDVVEDIPRIKSDYQPAAETPFVNRATRAMPPADKVTLKGKGRTRNLLNPHSELFEKLRLWTPKLRRHKRVLMNAIRSGYGLLEEMKAPYGEKAGPGDIIEDMLDQRMHISQVHAGRTRTILKPVLDKLDKQIKARGGKAVEAHRAAVDHDIINYIERNTPLSAKVSDYQDLADELKEAWRKVNRDYVEAFITEMRDLSHREQITKVGSKGRQRWSPEPMGQFTWLWNVKDPNGDAGAFVEKEALKKARTAKPEERQALIDNLKTYTIAEAFADTDQLWYPHQYDRDHLRNYNAKIEQLIADLNAIAAEGKDVSDEVLARTGARRVDGGFYIEELNAVLPSVDDLIKHFLEVRDRTATLLQVYEDGTIGMYPHLERVRETQDRLYKRNMRLLLTTSELLWDRFAEIAVFGQIDAYGSKLPARLATILQTVDLFHANDREEALMKVVDGLQASKESRVAASDGEELWGMHESIPAFEGGERAAYDIMQLWQDYYIDADGKKVKTGKWKGIDINRLELDKKTLNELNNIGFIAPDGNDGWKVRGKTDAEQQKTIARFFVELMQTRSSRKKRIQRLIQSLGHWQQNNSLTEDSDELWKRANTLTTIGALGWVQAARNLTEIPLIAMMTGTKSTVDMIKNMRDPEFRAAAKVLTEGLQHGLEFLSDDTFQQEYLNSNWSVFGKTEQLSRTIGVSIGISHAKNLTRQLATAQNNPKTKARLAREARSLRMNPDVLEKVPIESINSLFNEMIKRIKSGEIALGGVYLPSTSEPKNAMTDRIAEEWIRSAMYVSDTIFKPYDARTLPDEFQKRSAFARMILKFKSWMYQQNSFVVRQYKNAYREAATHQNYLPLGRILLSTLMLTGSVGAMQTLLMALQGNRDDDDKLLRSFLQTQTLGLSSVMWEMALRSEGSPWRLEKSVEGILGGPVIGIFADIIAPTATGDLDTTVEQVLRRTPLAREALYFGANRLFDEDENETE